ncbi:hypothetical protein MRX96_004149 [Rhipicephalus microplus]
MHTSLSSQVCLVLEYAAGGSLNNAISHGLLLLRCYHQCFRGNDCYPSSPLRQHHGWSIVVLLEGFVGTSCRRFHACSSLEPSIRPPGLCSTTMLVSGYATQ